MESIGQNLRQTRESRGLSVEQVSRETNISRHYIVALEEDRYEVFPAEPYVIGFLRNYSDHLNLDTEELINRFRTLRIQEQPAPLDALIQKPRAVSSRVVLIAGLVVAGIVLLIFLVPALVDFAGKFPKMMSQALPGHQAKTYELTSDKKDLDQRFFKGDSLVLDFSGKTYRFLIKSLGSELTLSGDTGEYQLRLGDTLFLDLDGNAVQDVRFFLRDLVQGQPDKGAELSVERVGAVTPLAEGSQTPGTENITNTPAAGSSSVIEEKPIVVQQAAVVKPFSVDVVFHNAALLRYVVDGNLRQENYYNKGQTIHIDADKQARILVSNAAAVGIQVNGVDLSLGKNGQVATRTLEWVKDPATGTFQLVADPLY